MADGFFDVVVFGSINTDFAFKLEDFPKPGETLLSSGMRSSPGGKGSNQAVASARMGAKVAMIGAVGDDDRGVMLRQFLDDNDVDTDRVRQNAGVLTGLAAIFVNRSGENLIVVDQGANALVDPDLVTADLPGASYYLSQLETPVPTIQAFFAAGRAKSGRCVLNAAPASLSAKKLFRLCDVIIINEPELSIYAGGMPDDANLADIGAAAKKLLSHDEQTIIVTRGKQGAVAVRRDAKLAVEAHPTEAADTTGAGDCFCGTLVAALAQGATLGAAISRANAAAALAVRQAGAADALPTSLEVDTFLETSTASMPTLLPC